MLYLIRFDIQQPEGTSLSELRKIWRQAPVAAQEPRGFGIIQSFKPLGQRTVFAVANFPNEEALDEVLTTLLMVEELGSAVKIDVIPVWPYDEPDSLGGELEELAQGAKRS